MKLLRLLTLLLFVSFGMACGSDDDPDNGNVDCDSSFSISIEIQDELDAISVAANAYITDPSASNCQAYKDALQDYLDAISALEDCARQAGVLDEWNMSLAGAQAGVDDFNC